MATSLSDPFAALLQSGLITAHQRASIERHGAFRTFAALYTPTPRAPDVSAGPTWSASRF